MDTQTLNESVIRCISRTMRTSRTQNEDLIDACRFLLENGQITDPEDLPACPIREYITQRWWDHRALDLSTGSPTLGEIINRLENVEISLFQLMMAATTVYPAMADELSADNPFLSPQEENMEDSELMDLLMTINQCVAGQLGNRIVRGITYICWIAHSYGAVFELTNSRGTSTIGQNDFLIRSTWRVLVPDRPFASGEHFLDNWRAFPMPLDGLSNKVFHAPVTFFANGHSFPCCLGHALLTARAFRPFPPLPPQVSHLYTCPTAFGEPPFYFRNAPLEPSIPNQPFDARNPNEDPGELSA